jgi:methyl-galactoside transport system substrate-binding protein
MKTKSFFFLVTVGLLLSSCSKKVQETTVEPNSERTAGQPVVGFLIRNTQEPFLQEYSENMAKVANEKNVDLRIMDAFGDAETQRMQLDVLIDQGIRNFIIIPQTRESTDAIADKVAKVGGCVCFTNIQPTVTALAKSNKIYFASSPEMECGEMQAELLVDYFKKNPSKIKDNKIELLFLDGEKDHPAQLYRRQGLLEQLDALGYKVHIVDEVYADWIASLAQPAMDRWLSKYSNQFNAVVAENDDMAVGAISSLLAKKYTDTPEGDRDTDGDGLIVKVPVIGVDGVDEALLSIKDKYLYGTIVQNSALQASTSLDIVLRCQEKGTAIGYVTEDGIASCKECLDEEPMTDESILSRCYLVPFKPYVYDNK